MELRALDESNLRTVCTRFFNEQKQQPHNLIESKNTSDSTYSEYVLSSLTYDPNNFATSNMFEHDFFIYGKDDKYDFLIPLELGRILKIGHDEQETIISGEKQYQLDVKVTKDKNSMTRDYEGILKVVYRSDSNLVTLHLLPDFVSLSSQLKVLEFLRALLPKFDVNWDEGEIGISPDQERFEFKKIVDARYKLMLEVQKVFKELKISEDSHIGQFETNDDIFRQLEQLVEFYLYKHAERIELRDNEKARVFNFRIGDKHVIFYYHPSAERKVINFFSDEEYTQKMKGLVEVRDNNSPEKCAHSIYIFLDLRSLAFGLNINLEMIKKSFDSFDPYINGLARFVTSRFSLNCIRAFDITNKYEFLDLAEHILNQSYQSPTYDPQSFDAVIVKVNEIQVRKRRNPVLNEIDIETLLNFKILYSFKEFIDLHFSVNVLLNNLQEAKFAFARLNKEQ